MAARKRWRRYIPDDEISVRAFLHLIGRLFYYVGLHSEYFLLNFGRGQIVNDADLGAERKGWMYYLSDIGDPRCRPATPEITLVKE